MNLEQLKQQSKECSKLSANNTSDKMLIFIICTALKPQLQNRKGNTSKNKQHIWIGL